MRWFEGGIAEAVTLAKTKNSIFVVYCEGKDKNSQELTNLIETEKVKLKLESEKFVAIRIESDKEEYVQFCKIYQLVPVPSIFFIKNGVPLKVITSAMKTADAIEEAIDSILKSESTTSPVNASQQFLAAEVASGSSPTPPLTSSLKKEEEKIEKSPEIVCEDGVCYKKETTAATTSTVENADKNDEVKVEEEETEEQRQEKIRHAMKLIGEKRAERMKEEERKERERELQRRKEGQELLKLKEWQNEQEMKQLKDDRLKEKNEAKAARQRVLDQIAQDKKERAQRFQQFAAVNVNADQANTSSENKSPSQPTTPITPLPNTTRIQFKKPDGESEIVTFDSDMLFADLHAFVKNDLLQATNIKNFTLATTFPRYEFTTEDFNKTLIDLKLVPSSVILIIPVKTKTPSPTNFIPTNIMPTQTDGSMFDMIKALIIGLFSPVFALFTYVGRFVTGNRNGNEDNAESDAGKRKRNEEILTANDAAKRRNLNTFFQQTPTSSTAAGTDDQPGTSQSGAYKRTKPSNNIHRLHQETDSEEEDRKTWNGNSTQQL